jgi:hypothetical protein
MPITVAEARRTLLSYPKATAAPHFDRQSYRAGRRIFATLRERDGELNVMLPRDLQQTMCEDSPRMLSPVPGGWGPMGWTRLDLANADAVTLKSVLDAAVAESLVNKRAKHR